MAERSISSRDPQCDVENNNAYRKEDHIEDQQRQHLCLQIGEGMPLNQRQSDSLERMCYRQKVRKLLAPAGKNSDWIVHTTEKTGEVEYKPIDRRAFLEYEDKATGE